MDDSVVLGVDIGGTHVTAALVSLKNGEILPGTELRASVTAKASAETIIREWTTVFEKVFASFPTREKKIGIAMPGPFDYEDGISKMKDQDKYDALYGLNIKNILADRMGIDAGCIRFVNDAECFLKGEVFGGALKKVRSAYGFTLGTGLGSSRYKNGVVEDADLWKAPFLDSTAEEYLSTRWFTNRYKSLTAQDLGNVKELAVMSDSTAVRSQIFHEFGKNLALFLNRYAWNDKPEAIVLGGNIAHSYDLFREALISNLSDAFIDTQFFKSKLGENACLLGAASAWNEPVPIPYLQAIAG